MDVLPVIYESQRNTWMNSEVFAEWFKKDFVLAVKCHQCAQNIRSPIALLLMDNCSANPQELKTCDGSITCMFLPPNTTSLIQTMKNCHKRKLLQKVICDQDLDPTQNIKEIIKQHTVKDALYVLADVWEEGHAALIFKAYSKLQIHPVWPNVSKCFQMFLLLMLKTGLMSKMSSQLCHSCPTNKF